LRGVPLRFARGNDAHTMLKALLATLCLLGVDSRRLAARNASSGRSAGPLGAGKIFYQSVLAFTRFNCAFPFCPTTALDVCTMDEHYEVGRPHVIATLIPQTTTADMAFFAYSAFDNATRLHYTLAPRVVAGAPFTQLFTVFIELNGTSGHQVGAGVEVALPGDAAGINYFFTHQGAAYVTFENGLMYSLNPANGAVGNATRLLPAGSQLTDTKAAVFDEKTGTLWVNAKGVAPSGAEGYFLHSFNVGAGAPGPLVGPLPATPTTGSNPGGLRADDAVATLAVYPPASVDPAQALRLMEMRTSPLFPWLFMAWLDPLTGNSTEVPLPDQSYENYDIDPEIFPEQWPGSARRVWAYDPITQQAMCEPPARAPLVFFSRGAAPAAWSPRARPSLTRHTRARARSQFQAVRRVRRGRRLHRG